MNCANLKRENVSMQRLSDLITLMRLGALCVSLALALRPLAAQEKQEKKSGALGYLAMPKERATAAVMLLHDNYGLDQWTKSLCDSLAREGFIAFAVDFYRARTPQDFMEAHELERALPETEAQQSIAAAMRFLKENLKAKRIGVIGIAMGGALGLEFAASQAGQDLSALLVNYAALPDEVETVKNIACPVMAHFGENDIGIDRTSILRFAQMMKAHKKTLDAKTYPKAAFGFLRPTNDAYHAETASDVWTRTLRFLKEHLLNNPKP